MNKNKGFTLIELLVVIAIIGILASVVLASLSSARNKGKDAAVKSQLASMKAQAELYLSTTADENYAGICGAGAGSLNALLLATIASEGASVGATPNTTLATAGSATLVTCHENGDAWAVDAPLVAGNTNETFYCTDSTGVSKAKAAALAAGAVAC